MASERLKWSFGMTFYMTLLFGIGKYLLWVYGYPSFAEISGVFEAIFLGANVYKNYLHEILRQYGLTEEEIKEIDETPTKRGLDTRFGKVAKETIDKKAIK